MLKYTILLAVALVVLAASDEAQARGFRRSRGTCPNGQCAAPVESPSKVAIASDGQAAAAVAAAPAVESPVVTAPVAVAPVATTTNVVASSGSSDGYRSTRLFRFFARR